MKVCFVGHSGARWGADLCLLDCVQALAEAGVPTSVILPRSGPIVADLQSYASSVQVIPYRWWVDGSSRVWKRAARTAMNLASAASVAAAIRRSACDVVCTNTLAVSVGAFAARWLGIPHIWWVHEFGYDDHGLTYDLGAPISLRLMDRLSTICVANSFAVAEMLRKKIPSEKVRVIHPVSGSSDLEGTPHRKLLGSGEDNFKCAFVGRLAKAKRPEDAIRAMAELVHRGHTPHLYVAGSGGPEYEAYLHRLIEEYEIARYVSLLGYIKNPYDVLSQVDCLIMCSPCEAFGRVTLEAMAAGKPVIGARGGGTPEMINDGYNGLLYSPGSHSELADKIEHLLKNQALAKRMGKNGRLRARSQFGSARYTTEVLDVLKEALCGPEANTRTCAQSNKPQDKTEGNFARGGL